VTTSATPSETPSPEPLVTATPIIYRVKSGDNLYNIALEYGTTVQAIMMANGLANDRLRVGQELIIPTGTVTPLPVPTQTPTPAPTPTPS
jgi:LysM repeat protein